MHGFVRLWRLLRRRLSVWVPGLPGCVSQGATEQEALANIADAIREYLQVVMEQVEGAEVREIEVAA
jgi:predicted RNase H-like HicB family nuclease